MKNTIYLHEKISAVCPIDGVSSSGRIDFKPEATEAQRKAAQVIADAWDFDAPSAAELNAPILAQLASLDAQRVRPMAEITLAQVAGEPLPLYAKAKLADIEKQAAELREKLK